MLQKDLLHYGETEAGAVHLGGEKGPEQLWQDVWSNARSIIEDAESLDRFVGSIRRFAGDEYFWLMRVGGRCFRGVPDKIQEGLAQQAFVADNITKLAVQSSAHLRQDFADFANDAVE